MVDIRSYLRFLLSALVVGAAATASAQRIQFPTQNGTAGVAPPATFGGTVDQAPTWDPYQPGSPLPQSGIPYQGGATPQVPLYPQPSYAPQETYPQQQQGSYSQQPPYLFPGGSGGGQQSIFSQGGVGYTLPATIFGRWNRFRQQILMQYTWLGDDTVGFDIVDVNATFAFPWVATQAPVLITPGFAFNFTNGPVSLPPVAPPPLVAPFDDPMSADLPAQMYDAYLDAAWKPAITPWLRADLGVRVGIYSDFQKYDSEAIRVMGHGLGVVSYSPTKQFALGVVYLDRLRVKLLPAGGLIWTPNPDRRYEILFPNPKLSHRWRTIGTTEWWWYVSGEYGGGQWYIQRSNDNVPGGDDVVNYNDIRLILGTEWHALSGVRGFFEAGYVFDRELLYKSDFPSKLGLDDTFMLRGGLTF